MKGFRSPATALDCRSCLLGSVATLLCIAAVACVPPSPDPSKAVPYSPRYDEVVPLETVEPNPAMPALTPEPLPEGRAFEIPEPTSEQADPNTWYSFVIGHCGIGSPIDFDGSYWIPIAASADPRAEGINSTPGKVRLVDDQTLEFRTSTGYVARLRRHDEATWFWICD